MLVEAVPDQPDALNVQVTVREGDLDDHDLRFLSRDLQVHLALLVPDKVKCLLDHSNLVAAPWDDQDEVVGVAEK